MPEQIVCRHGCMRLRGCRAVIAPDLGAVLSWPKRLAQKAIGERASHAAPIRIIYTYPRANVEMLTLSLRLFPTPIISFPSD